ncbi:hypothetical protein PRNP1_007409 [Phytophthora ramorum]
MPTAPPKSKIIAAPSSSGGSVVSSISDSPATKNSATSVTKSGGSVDSSTSDLLTTMSSDTAVVITSGTVVPRRAGATTAEALEVTAKDVRDACISKRTQQAYAGSLRAISR